LPPVDGAAATVPGTAPFVGAVPGAKGFARGAKGLGLHSAPTAVEAAAQNGAVAKGGPKSARYGASSEAPASSAVTSAAAEASVSTGKGAKGAGKGVGKGVGKGLMAGAVPGAANTAAAAPAAATEAAPPPANPWAAGTVNIKLKKPTASSRLGITLKGNSQSAPTILTVVPGCIAAESGEILPGQLLVAVNGEAILGHDHGSQVMA